MKYQPRLSFFVLLLLPAITFAQETEMADTFRSEGKIYVVIAVMAIILTGLFLYLFSLGKKIAGIEKKLAGKP
jgi:CcmD family protein